MLEIRNLTKHYGKTAAVDDVSLRLEKREFFCLLGPSGCGKSTLLRMVAGFEKQDSGGILLDGKEISALPPYRRDVNMVFQNYALFPHLNVFDNVAYGLRVRKKPKGEIRERVTKAPAQVDLPGYETRLPSQLSGGQKQRVALARALVNEPSVLRLDEPMSALDKKISEQMRRELKALRPGDRARRAGPRGETPPRLFRRGPAQHLRRHRLGGGAVRRFPAPPRDLGPEHGLHLLRHAQPRGVQAPPRRPEKSPHPGGGWTADGAPR